MPENLITISEGTAMTATYRAKRPNMLAPGLSVKTLPICETFRREAFDTLLSLGNCVAIRVYCGMDENLNMKFVICGVDSNNEDLYIPGPESAPEEKFVIEAGVRCPETCPPDSLLSNS